MPLFGLILDSAGRRRRPPTLTFRGNRRHSFEWGFKPVASSLVNSQSTATRSLSGASCRGQAATLPSSISSLITPCATFLSSSLQWCWIDREQFTTFHAAPLPNSSVVVSNHRPSPCLHYRPSRVLYLFVVTES